jgi:hypothetical protein
MSSLTDIIKKNYDKLKEVNDKRTQSDINLLLKIESNTEAISDTNLALSEQVAGLSAIIAANTTNIATNTANIASNVDAITSNATNISNNAAAISLINTELPSKLTAPSPSDTVFSSLISDTSGLSWSNFDIVAPNSPASTKYVADYLQLHSHATNNLGVIEYADSVDVSNSDFTGYTLKNLDLFINYLTGSMWRYNGTNWISTTPPVPTSDDFYEVNVFLDGGGQSGTLNWFKDVGTTDYYWYYRINARPDVITVDNISIDKTLANDLQIKGFNDLADNLLLSKTNGVIEGLSAQTIVTNSLGQLGDGDVNYVTDSLMIKDTYTDAIKEWANTQINNVLSEALGDIESLLAEI